MTTVEPMVGNSDFELFLALLLTAALIFIAVSSQVYWLRRLDWLVERWVDRGSLRKALKRGGLAAYFLLLIYNLTYTQLGPTSTRLTVAPLLFWAPFRWWFFGSLFGFALVILLTAGFRAISAAARATGKVLHREESVAAASLDRRQFITAFGTLPFAAGAYGLLLGRTDFEITHRRIALPALPKAFDGIRVAQLSDFHIGPFMTAREIRDVVEMAMGEKPDLILLTGDYVTWDARTQGAVVEALSKLHAPLGVFGCLGNHEIYTRTQASITRLFAARGIRILRQERADVFVNGERINLIGVDFQTRSPFRSFSKGFVTQYLEGVGDLKQPDTVNILLSHNPNTFDRAAELGIDLSLAGHTHGGQVALEFLSPELSPALLFTPYVAGRFQKPGGQVYVNRGIGTIGVPIRLGVPPEITIFQWARS